VYFYLENNSTSGVRFYGETSSKGNFARTSRRSTEERFTADCAFFTCLLEELDGVCQTSGSK
jgi:hypothetical protein